MYYYLYQITNNLNKKIYVGVHKTNDLNDGYMGSGRVIRRAIQKHGISNFSKDILETFDTSEAMYAREKEVVNEEFLSRDDVYNLRRGGYGGFEFINKEGKNIDLNEQRKRDPTLLPRSIELSKKSYKIWMEQVGKDEISKRAKHASSFSPRFEGLNHREESKEKIGKSNSIKQLGDKNSQAGTMWITNGLENKKIKKTDSLPRGFRKGRIVY